VEKLTAQKAAFDEDLTNDRVGEAAIDAMGRIHLSFVSHRKITVGEAVVAKVANGKFQGILNLAGDEWEFEMTRR
jgi:hypothetical protein